ncbi:MAG: potassium channel family protein [Granulosicoccaceae bacterium]
MDFSARRQPVKLLHLKPQRPPEVTLMLRGGIILLLLVLTVVVFWIDRDGLVDHIDGELSFADVLYFTAVTLTTVGYGDIVPVSESARLFDAFLVAPIRLLIWVIFLGTTYQFVLQKYIELIRLKRMEEKLVDHVVVCGYGHGGRVAAKELLARGYLAEQVLVVEPSSAKLQQAVDEGYIGLSGDATDEELLKRAKINKAKAVIVAVERDDAAAMVVLTVRSLAPEVRLIARVDEEVNGKLLRKAGADTIVPAARIGGFLLAGSVEENDNLPLVADMLSARGAVSLVEREALDDEIGLRSDALVHRIVISLRRADKNYVFTADSHCVIERGDVITLIEQAGRNA